MLASEAKPPTPTAILLSILYSFSEVFPLSNSFEVDSFSEANITPPLVVTPKHKPAFFMLFIAYST